MKLSVSNSFYNLLGQLGSAFWQWILTIWIIRIFGTEELGKFTYILSMVSPILLLTNFQLRNRIASQLYLLKQVNSLLRLRFFTIWLSIGISFFIVYFVEDSITTFLLLSVLFLKGLESLSDITFGILQAEDNLKQVGISQIIKAAAALVLMAIAWYFQFELWQFFSALVICHIGIIFFAEWRIVRNYSLDVSQEQKSVWLMFKEDPALLSMGLMACLSSINGNWPRYFLQHYWGLSELGKFSSVFAIYAVLGLLINAWLQGALRPMGSAKTYIEKRTILKRLSLEIIAFHLIIGLIVIPFNDQIFQLIYGSEMGIDSKNLTLLVLLSFIASFSTLTSYFLVANNQMQKQWQVMIVANITTIIICFWTIPDNPIDGSMMALLGGLFIQLVCYLYFGINILMKDKHER